MTANYTDLTAFNQENMDSLIKANTAAAKGFEQLAKYFVDLASKSFEDAVAAGKKIAAAKSPTEVVQINTKIAQESLETFIEESKKVAEMTSVIFKEVSAPLTAQFKSVVAAAPKAAAATMKKAA
jgi:phasin family protein